MWNFAKQREKFKHLTNQTPCICGVGKYVTPALTKSILHMLKHCILLLFLHNY